MVPTRNEEQNLQHVLPDIPSMINKIILMDRLSLLLFGTRYKERIPQAQPEIQKIPILMYHSISEHASLKFKQFTVSPQSFNEQMAYLHQHKYTPITVSQFVEAQGKGGQCLPARPVVLTFDDGFEDFYTDALPILKHYHFAATLYVATGFVNKTSHWLQHEGETDAQCCPGNSYARSAQAASNVEVIATAIRNLILFLSLKHALKSCKARHSWNPISVAPCQALPIPLATILPLYVDRFRKRAIHLRVLSSMQ
ncbi:MAG: polysaccharide deacetylase family protein [Ktedonobacteraceae bacterium]|nr:polysaccharide deacetylase family protein [Ktedonobacteraceae bacterium]